MNSRTLDCLIAVVITLGSIILLGQLKGIPREGYIFPGILLFGMIFCSAIVFILGLIKGDPKEKIHVFKDVPFGRWLTVVSVFILYVLGMFNLGFFVSTFIAALAITSVLSGNRWKPSLPGNLIFAGSLTILFYLFFVQLMKVRFPETLLM